MRSKSSVFRDYVSLFLLFVPVVLFLVFLLYFRDHDHLRFKNDFPYLPWQFSVLAIAGTIATIGGVLDWRFHRVYLKMKISKKEREAEAAALGLGGLPMFILMCCATLSAKPSVFLIPIILVLIYTVVAISYDEFVFHIRRCEKTETIYHRMLVFGNGIAWLAWFHLIYC